MGTGQDAGAPRPFIRLSLYLESRRGRARRRWSFFRTDWEERKDILDAIKGGEGGGGMTFVLSPFLREHVGGGAANGATCVEPKNLSGTFLFLPVCPSQKRGEIGAFYPV